MQAEHSQLMIGDENPGYIFDRIVSEKEALYVESEGRLSSTDKKVILKRPLTNNKLSIEKLKNEAEVLQALGNHKNIRNLISCIIDDAELTSVHNRTILCYEFIDGESVSSLLMHSNVYSDVDVLLSVASALSHMHSCGFMHRDVKSSNVIIDHKKSIVKLAGFNLACNFRTADKLTPETGTYRWMAPEIIRRESYNNCADVYSFGVFMWELFTREVPYADMNAIQAAYLVAKEKLRPYMSLAVNARKKALMSRCWHDDPLARPTFEDIEALLPSLRV